MEMEMEDLDEAANAAATDGQTRATAPDGLPMDRDAWDAAADAVTSDGNPLAGVAGQIGRPAVEDGADEAEANRLNAGIPSSSPWMGMFEPDRSSAVPTTAGGAPPVKTADLDEATAQRLYLGLGKGAMTQSEKVMAFGKPNDGRPMPPTMPPQRLGRYPGR
jgi:hypothetical protein